MAVFEPNQVVDPLVRLRLFGPVEARSFSGESVLPRGRKAQAILAYLALSPDAVVPRQRFVDLLWSRRWGEQGRASLRQSLLELRAALGPCGDELLTVQRDRIGLARGRVWVDGLSRRADEPASAPGPAPAGAERLLETLVGLDPQFDAWIHGLRKDLAATRRTGRAETPTAGDGLQPASAAASDHEPSRGLVLSVAPLIQIGADAIDDYVAPALTQEIVTALARFRWFQVRYSHAPHTVDAQYRLEGYINRLGAACRVVVRLIDQADRDIIAWTGAVETQYPLPYSAIAEVVERVVEQLDPEILAIETRKAMRRPPASRDSYDCVLQATPLLYRFDRASWEQATGLLQQALAADPMHGRAFAFSALCRVTGLAQGWSDEPDEDLRRLGREAAHAIACDPRDSLALALSGHIASFLTHDFAGAQALFERAIRANPSCGFSWGYSSLTYAYLGRTDEAAERLARAQALMIHDPYRSFMESFQAVIAWFAHDWPVAMDACRRQLDQRPTFTNMRKLLIGALCFTGQFEEARREHERLMQDEPAFGWDHHLESYPFGRGRDRAALAAALRRARLLPDARPAAPARPKADIRLVAAETGVS